MDLDLPRPGDLDDHRRVDVFLPFDEHVIAHVVGALARHCTDEQRKAEKARETRHDGPDGWGGGLSMLPPPTHIRGGRLPSGARSISRMVCGKQERFPREARSWLRIRSTISCE